MVDTVDDALPIADLSRDRRAFTKPTLSRRMSMTPTAPKEWGVLLKVRASSDAPAPSRAQLGRLLAALPGGDKKLTGGGVDFTVWSWVDAADAVAATSIGARTLRAIARAEGLPSLTIVRAHAASVEGRSSPFRGVAARLGSPHIWSVYFKAEAPLGSTPATADLLERVRVALDRPDVNVTLRGDNEKFLVDDGSGFTARFWAAGATAAEAFRAARRDMIAALGRVGLEGWTLVRFQAATADARHGDTFPGVGSRRARRTEETR